MMRTHYNYFQNTKNGALYRKKPSVTEQNPKKDKRRRHLKSAVLTTDPVPTLLFAACSKKSPPKKYIPATSKNHRQQRIKKARHSSRKKSFLSRQQIIGLIFLCLVASAASIEVHNEISFYPARTIQKLGAASKDTSDTELAQQIKAICSTRNLYRIANKPQDMRMDKSLNGSWTSSKCAQAERAQPELNVFEENCVTTSIRMQAWPQSAEAKKLDALLTQSRTHINREVAQVFTHLTAACNDLAKTIFIPADISTLFNYCNRIWNFKKWQISERYATLFRVGNCGEHTETSLSKLLRLSAQFKKIIPFQWIHVKKQGQGDHVFATILGDAADIDITHNESATTAYLSKLSKGNICDSWNFGFYKPLTQAFNALYKYGWDSISVINYSLSLNLTGLSPEIINFFNKQLDELGLSNLFGKETFSFFSQKKTGAGLTQLHFQNNNQQSYRK